MKIAFIDPFAGASGDMLLGALLAAGLPIETLRADLESLRVPGWSIEASTVKRGAIAATHVDVRTEDRQAGARHPEGGAHHANAAAHDEHADHRPHGRALPELLALVDAAPLPDPIVEGARRVLRRLAEVEAGVHDQPVEKVHLHELGGLDTIVDVVGVLAGFHRLGVERIFVGRIPVAEGSIGSQHGTLPLPAPASLALLRDVPLRYVAGMEAELVTPTGAALLTELARGSGGGFGTCPDMTLRALGYGAGTRELPIPNVLRLWIGETREAAAGADAALTTEALVELACNIDDMPGEHFGFVMDLLFGAGALDVTFTPSQMKKNRPATTINVLSRPGDAGALGEILLRHTSTLGVRRSWVERLSLPRETFEVETRYGKVRVKAARLGEDLKLAAEFDDCRALAERAGVSLAEVERAAVDAARARMARP